MTDILAKATVEFGQPLISLNFRQRHDDEEGISSVWKSTHEPLFQINFQDHITCLYEVDIHIRRHYYGHWNMTSTRGDKRISKHFISIKDKFAANFTFSIDISSLQAISLTPSETLLITFIVRRQERVDFVSEVKKRLREDAVAGGSGEVRINMDDTLYEKIAELQEDVQGLYPRVNKLEGWKEWVDSRICMLRKRTVDLKEAETRIDKKLSGLHTSLTLLISDVLALKEEKEDQINF